MKNAILAIAALAILLTSTDTYAEPPVQRNAAKAGPGGPNNGQLRQREPQQIAGAMMKKFDVDGDQKLDTKELTALLTSLRQRGGQSMARRGVAAGKGKGAGANARRRGGIDVGSENAKPGGQRPKRPDRKGESGVR